VIRFIHIKKNGGTSVYKFLAKNKIECFVGPGTNMERVLNQHQPAIDYLGENSWKFCVCRNPYTRVISFYNWTKRMNKYQIDFEEFVRTGYNIGRAKGTWNNQVDYILNDRNECLVDKIFRFENLENEIKEHFNINADFPHLTKSTYDDYEDYYTDDLKEFVYLRLKKDFEYFNYEK